MKILVDISPEHYDRLLSQFTEESRIYAILKNGLVIHHFEAGNEIRMVEILCDKFYARMILAAAEIYCPEAAAEGSKSRSGFPAHYTDMSVKPSSTPTGTR